MCPQAGTVRSAGPLRREQRGPRFFTLLCHLSCRSDFCPLLLRLCPSLSPALSLKSLCLSLLPCLVGSTPAVARPGRTSRSRSTTQRNVRPRSQKQPHATHSDSDVTATQLGGKVRPCHCPGSLGRSQPTSHDSSSLRTWSKVRVTQSPELVSPLSPRWRLRDFGGGQSDESPQVTGSCESGEAATSLEPRGSQGFRALGRPLKSQGHQRGVCPHPQPHAQTPQRPQVGWPPDVLGHLRSLPFRLLGALWGSSGRPPSVSLHLTPSPQVPVPRAERTEVRSVSRALAEERAQPLAAPGSSRTQTVLVCQRRAGRSQPRAQPRWPQLRGVAAPGTLTHHPCFSDENAAQEKENAFCSDVSSTSPGLCPV